MSELNAQQFERLVNKIENMLLTDKNFRRDVAAEQAAEFSLEKYEGWLTEFPDEQFYVDSLWASCEICFKLTPECCAKCGVRVCQDCQDIHICEKG